MFEEDTPLVLTEDLKHIHPPAHEPCQALQQRPKRRPGAAIGDDDFGIKIGDPISQSDPTDNLREDGKIQEEWR